jgi:putative phage-type endonuclease
MEIIITHSEDNWLDTRKGKFTASEIHKVMGKGNPLSKTAETFVYEKCAELLTGESKPIYSPAIDWGKNYESHAFHYFSLINFDEFTYYGGETYVFIPYGDHSGYSPDGLSKDAILEIKCPYNSAIHLKNFTIYDADSLKALHPEYYWQMQLGMIAADLDKGYFVSYDPRMPQGKVIHVAEIERHLVQDEIDEKLNAAAELLNNVIRL